MRKRCGARGTHTALYRRAGTFENVDVGVIVVVIGHCQRTRIYGDAHQLDEFGWSFGFDTALSDRVFNIYARHIVYLRESPGKGQRLADYVGFSSLQRIGCGRLLLGSGLVTAAYSDGTHCNEAYQFECV